MIFGWMKGWKDQMMDGRTLEMKGAESAGVGDLVWRLRDREAGLRQLELLSPIGCYWSTVIGWAGETRDAAPGQNSEGGMEEGMRGRAEVKEGIEGIISAVLPGTSFSFFFHFFFLTYSVHRCRFVWVGVWNRTHTHTHTHTHPHTHIQLYSDIWVRAVL